MERKCVSDKVEKLLSFYRTLTYNWERSVSGMTVYEVALTCLPVKRLKIIINNNNQSPNS